MRGVMDVNVEVEKKNSYVTELIIRRKEFSLNVSFQ
jgi:hypothetical protein